MSRLAAIDWPPAGDVGVGACLGRRQAPRGRWRVLMLAALLAAVAARGAAAADARAPLGEALSKVVKIFGAGGPQRLEAYQSGILVSPRGHVLTVWSYVLDTDRLQVVLDDGRSFLAELAGADPAREVALLKIDAADLPYFAWDASTAARPGARVWALSNAFGVAQGAEAASVQHGLVATVARWPAEPAAPASAPLEPLIVVDAVTSNPGAAGGALVDAGGQLLGMLGRERRNNDNGTWVSLAVPMASLQPGVARWLAGEATPTGTETVPLAHEESETPRARGARLLPRQWGLVLVPNVLPRTPAYVERTLANSPAQRAGLLADDLIVELDGRLVHSCSELEEMLRRRDPTQPWRLSVRRGAALLQIVVRPLPGSDG